MKAFLELIREIDFYGKAHVFYFKGRVKKISTIGRIFTLLIIILYIVFLFINLNDYFLVLIYHFMIIIKKMKT